MSETVSQWFIYFYFIGSIFYSFFPSGTTVFILSAILTLVHFIFSVEKKEEEVSHPLMACRRRRCYCILFEGFRCLGGKSTLTVLPFPDFTRKMFVEVGAREVRSMKRR